MDQNKTWKKILKYIKSQISPANYRTWFSNTDLNSLTEDALTICVPSAFIKEQLRLRYLSLIEEAVKKTVGGTINIEYKINPAKFVRTKDRPQEEEEMFAPIAPQTPVLNPRFTLENFVVGLSNNVAYAAAQAVVQNPGISYNPLFLYGGTGVGKTHLMLGIGNAILKNNPNLKVIYCSSEKFTNDYVEAIQTHKTGELRARYRSTNLLLIDDIQFFSGREGTQEEFFHTFNELQTKNSQLVLTSDRPPNDIAKLEDRLKSRFQGGLMIDIQPPDFDTRVAILQAKCQQKGEVLPEDTLKLIASSLDSNIRELEGKLIQILQSLKTQNLLPTPENVAYYLGQSTKRSMITDHKQVLSAICSYFNLNLKDLTGPNRQKELVLPRHIAMYILSEEMSMTVEKIGNLLGGRDHTTVMHGRDRIKKLINTDREVQKIFIEVKQKLSSPI